MDEPLLRLSSLAVVLPLGGDRAFASHAVRGRPLVVDGAVGRVLQAFSSPRTLSELEGLLAHEPPGSVAAIVAELGARDLLTSLDPEQELEETRRWVEQVHGVKSDGVLRVRERMRAEFAPAEHLDSAPPALVRRAVVLGWCTAEALVPALREEGRARGVSLDVLTGFEEDSDLAARHAADFTLLGLGNVRLLAPLFASESEQALATAVAECGRLIQAAAAHTPGTLLVQGAVAPQHEPLGLVGALCENSLADRVVELNRGIRRAVCACPGAVYLDIERLLAGAGKSRLLDDLVAPWAHAGVAGGSGNPDYHRLVARACFDALDAAEARGAIRCVAVDLDGLLWPGEIADPSFSFQDERCVTSLLYGVHGGIHEALGALRARGIVLAVVSKNVHESVVEKWRGATTGELASASHLLSPESFAALKIGWTDKSRAIEELSRELGIAPSAIAFVDDTPLERAEVQHALPDVWVLDCPVEKVREVLLSSPRFEVFERSPEARARAEATRSRVQRDRALTGALDRPAFLQGLGVRCVLGQAREGGELNRAFELLARTHQFRTSAEQLSRVELERLARDPRAGVLTLAVSDRFGAYGVVGVAVTEGAEVRLFALSCRVIGAEVHEVLLRAALERCRAAAPGVDVIVRFSDTPHNAPARRLFETGQWADVAVGRSLRASAALPPAPVHCRVTRA